MRGASSPAGLLTLLVVSALFLLVGLLAWERAGTVSGDPDARHAAAQAAEALSALPDGSPLLEVPPGARIASFAGEIPGGPAGWATDWTVQQFRWDAGRGTFVPSVDGGPLLRVTVRVRPRRAASALNVVPSGVRTFLRGGLAP